MELATSELSLYFRNMASGLQTAEVSTRRRMARERRGAESSVASMETLNYKTIY